MRKKTERFPQIFDAALEEYLEKTEKNIKTDPLFAKFQDYNSSDVVIKVLEDQALAFENYQQGDRKLQLMRRLKPISSYFEYVGCHVLPVFL